MIGALCKLKSEQATQQRNHPPPLLTTPPPHPNPKTPCPPPLPLPNPPKQRACPQKKGRASPQRVGVSDVKKRVTLHQTLNFTPTTGSRKRRHQGGSRLDVKKLKEEGEMMVTSWKREGGRMKKVIEYWTPIQKTTKKPSSLELDTLVRKEEEEERNWLREERLKMELRQKKGEEYAAKLLAEVSKEMKEREERKRPIIVRVRAVIIKREELEVALPSEELVAAYEAWQKKP